MHIGIIHHFMHRSSSFFSYFSADYFPRFALQHRARNRYRCSQCMTEFCGSCKSYPYHLGDVCKDDGDGDGDGVNAGGSGVGSGGGGGGSGNYECRFCETKLTGKDALPPEYRPNPALHVCHGQECLQIFEKSCLTVLDCDHPCGGVRNETSHLPCLKCAQEEDKSPNANEFCSICWTAVLGAEPCVKLGCGHIFHHACVNEKISKKWNGARVTFFFMDCPLYVQYL